MQTTFRLNKTIALFAIIIGTFAAGCAACAADVLAMSDKYAAGDFKLVYSGAAATIVVDPADAKVVRIAADALAGDIALVTGKKPAVAASIPKAARNVVVAGTLGKSKLIDALVKSRKIDVSKVRGKWETYMVAVVRKPVKGVDAALVIAGSDRRGTAYGLFEVSRAIGVSPWVWWADVAPDKKASLIVKKCAGVFGPPSVKYRGIFINDEAFGLNPWASKTFDPETGNIGPKTYAKVFELLLRLRANYIWSAMKQCTRAFNYYDADKYLADDYAIVAGSSHCEQMLRDSLDEWRRDGTGEWNYVTNKQNVLDYWERRVRSNAPFESIWTLGMRNLDDKEMPGDGTLDEKTRRLENIIADQREMIRKWINPDPSKVPQLLSPYKEVLDLYRNNLSLPDDVTILWTDDNFGFVRRLPTPAERKRSGGGGVYYHISYSGRPHDYLWLETTPPALIWEQMHKAWDFGARTIWVVNVGDIKPAEIGAEFFLSLAWNINEWRPETLPKFFDSWAARQFGAAHARETAAVLADYYHLNFIRKPEHLGYNEIEMPNTPVKDPDFSLSNYGDEVNARLSAFDSLERRATAIYDSLPAAKRAAFYELVLYPVRGSALMNVKVLNAFISREYAKQGRATTNEYARKSDAALAAIKDETAFYNEKNAGGKWNGMMSWKHHDRLIFREIKTGSYEPAAAPALGVAIEGQAKPLSAEKCAPGAAAAPECLLPRFNRFLPKRFFIDIFNRGTGAADWKAAASAPWIKLSKTSGSVAGEERIYAEADFAAAPAGENVSGTITIERAGASYMVGVSMFNPADVKVGKGVFVQDNGAISIDAGDFARAIPVGDYGWRVVPGLGRTGSAIALLPTSGQPLPAASAAAAPVAEYQIYVFTPGKVDITLQALPSHEVTEGYSLRCMVSVDDGQPAEAAFEQGNDEFDKVWKRNALRGYMEATVKMELAAGPHTLKVWGVDPSVALDRIEIDFGGVKKSALGPPETKRQ